MWSEDVTHANGPWEQDCVQQWAGKVEAALSFQVGFQSPCPGHLVQTKITWLRKPGTHSGVLLFTGTQKAF
jgi:hypothetical protein